MKINGKIKSLMVAAGLNQKQLAEKAQITEASMSKYLSGDRTPRFDVVVKLAKALNVPVDELAGEDQKIDDPFVEVSTALARCKDQLTEADKKKLMKFLLED